MANAINTLCLCDIGYAAVFGNATDGSGQRLTTCVQCPQGAVCDAVGTEYDSMLTQSGWWSPEPGFYYRCLVTTQCVGGAVSASAAQCQADYVGPLCAYCADGYAQSVDGQCNPCSSATNSNAYAALVLILFIGAFIGCLVVLIKSGDRLMDIGFAEEERARKAAAGYAVESVVIATERFRHGNIITLRGAPPPHPAITFKLKILLGFLQIVTNLSFGLSISWPPTFAAFINWFNPVRRSISRRLPFLGL